MPAQEGNIQVQGSEFHRVHPEHIDVLLSNGKVYAAKIISTAKPDIALIKINTGYPLRAITLGDSSLAKIGNPVLAVANARLNPQRMKSGNIIQVYAENSTQAVTILEMDIPLKEGDSGGPILNEQGLLLGLIMANKLSDHSKSFAIASNKIQEEYFKYKNVTLVSKL